MKKISTLTMLLLVGALSALAQTTNIFRFVDANGNTVPDGTELTITQTEDDGWGGVMMKTGLRIKSSQSGKSYGSMVYEILEIDNGAFQVCFPSNCTQSEEIGTTETPAGEVTTEDIQAEWMPEAYGTAKVTLQPKTYKYNSVTEKMTFVADGPKITLNFVYADPSGVTPPTADDAQETACYTLDGRQISQQQKGVNIVKTNNGKTKKVLINK